MKKLYKEKDLAIKMRLEGMSYSQIKEVIKVSKSTLSLWLEKYPLSQERMRELRDLNPLRIEKTRNTKFEKRKEKLSGIYKEMSNKIGKLSNRDIFISGIFLYWGEGTKTARDIVAFTNTNPNMVLYFIKWLEFMGVKKESLRVKLHLYKDMNIKDKTKYWSIKLNIPKKNFRKPYIKDSTFSSLTYKNSFGQGTCTVSYGNSDLHNKIIMSLKYLNDIVSTV